MTTRALQDRFGPLLLVAVCLLAVFSVSILNHGPLFYFDSFAYVDQGNEVLKMILPKGSLIAPPAVDATGLATGAVTGGANESVNGSRSVLFGVVMALFYQAHALWAFPVLAAVYTVATVWLPVRVAARMNLLPRGRLTMLCLPLLFAAAGSLPFYISYLMPDILAPGLIMISATLFAFGAHMRWGEVILAALLGVIAVVSHPSHLLISAVLMGMFTLIALISRHKGRWLAPMVLTVLVVMGGAERLMFRSAVKSIAKSEVTYFPYLTARLIADGPGLTYLQDSCPNAEIATCALFDALSKSDDPMRFTATHIVFETSERLGSFRLMPYADQKRVVEGQMTFARNVVMHDPFGLVAGLLSNTLKQARRDSIEMTVPSANQIAIAAAKFPEAHTFKGPLITDQSWIPAVEWIHQVVNFIAFLVVLGLLVWPGRVAAPVKLLAIAILMGLFANAFVCGAVSQPADRYGARVIWLLPMLATFMTLFAWPNASPKRPKL